MRPRDVVKRFVDSPFSNLNLIFHKFFDTCTLDFFESFIVKEFIVLHIGWMLVSVDGVVVKMNQDWVKKVLIKYNFFFLKNIKSDHLLDLLDQSLNEDISIEFDDRRLYLFKNNRDIFIEIDVRTPCEILELLLFLITEKQMLENIRNAENRIWFRSYKGNSFLDCQKNEICNELFWSASILCSAACTLTYFLRKFKGSAILVDDDYEKYLDEAKCDYRLKSGLNYVLDKLRKNS